MGAGFEVGWQTETRIDGQRWLLLVATARPTPGSAALWRRAGRGANGPRPLPVQ